MARRGRIGHRGVVTPRRTARRNYTPATVFAHASLTRVGRANLPMTKGARRGVPCSCMAAPERAMSGI